MARGAFHVISNTVSIIIEKFKVQLYVSNRVQLLVLVLRQLVTKIDRVHIDQISSEMGTFAHGPNTQVVRKLNNKWIIHFRPDTARGPEIDQGVNANRAVMTAKTQP